MHPEPARCAVVAVVSGDAKQLPAGACADSAWRSQLGIQRRPQQPASRRHGRRHAGTRGRARRRTSGRFWHAEAGLPLCDALMTVTRLLIALSHGDEPLSQVLDRDAPFELE